MRSCVTEMSKDPYCQQHEGRRFERVICRQLNPPMIDPTFKLSIRRASDGELPLKYVLLQDIEKQTLPILHDRPSPKIKTPALDLPYS